MRKLILLPLFVGLLSAPALVEKRSCTVIDASSAGPAVWLLCQEAKILVGSRDADDWIERTLPAQSELRAIRLLDAGRAVVVGDQGTLLYTSDSGSRWRRIPLPTQEHLLDVHSVGESIWAAGWGGVILHSPDGGRNWELQPTGVSQGLESIYFADLQHGWAVGWVGTILRTTDGGKTWQQVRSPAAQWSLTFVYFLDASNGWTVGFSGLILRSRDGGRTWEAQPSPVTSTLTSVLFDSQRRGWITTSDGLLLSEDGGQSWKHLRLGNWLFLTKVIRVDGSLWAAGPRGVLQQTGGSFAWKKIPTPAASVTQASA